LFVLFAIQFAFAVRAGNYRRQLRDPLVRHDRVSGWAVVEIARMLLGRRKACGFSALCGDVAQDLAISQRSAQPKQADLPDR
jgi:hypothetical protein